MYEFAGGDAAFLALAEAHHQRCLDEPELSHAFSHGFNPDHVKNLAAYWAEVFGGPPAYSERHGGHSAMLTLHAGTGMAEDWAERFCACFLQAVDDARLPGDSEFRRSLREYIEFAVQDIVTYSPPGSRVPAALAMPLWSWDGPSEPDPAP